MNNFCAPDLCTSEQFNMRAFNWLAESKATVKECSAPPEWETFKKQFRVQLTCGRLFDFTPTAQQAVVLAYSTVMQEKHALFLRDRDELKEDVEVAIEELQRLALDADQNGDHYLTHRRDSNNHEANQKWVIAASPVRIMNLIGALRQAKKP